MGGPDRAGATTASCSRSTATSRALAGGRSRSRDNVTRLKLTGADTTGTTGQGPRDVTVLAVSEPLTLAEAPYSADVQGATLRSRSTSAMMQPGARLLVRARRRTTTRRTDVLTMASATVDERGRVATALSRRGASQSLTSAPVPSSTATWRARRTARRSQQILGSGGAGGPFQRVHAARTSRSPMSSRADDPTGAASSLDRARQRRRAGHEGPTLYGARCRATAPTRCGPTRTARWTSRSATARTAPRLPTGSNNVRATYRKGLGAAGNVGAGAVASCSTGRSGQGRRATRSRRRGGVDPEVAARGAGIDPARRAHPRPRGLAARLRGLRARVHRRRQGERERPAAPRPGGRSCVTGRVRRAANRSPSWRTTLLEHGDPHGAGRSCSSARRRRSGSRSRSR